MNQAMGGNEASAASANSGSSAKSTIDVPKIISTSVMKSIRVSDKNEHSRSVSELMRLIRSPVRLPPKYCRLKRCKCENARLRRSALISSLTHAKTAPCAQANIHATSAAAAKPPR